MNKIMKEYNIMKNIQTIYHMFYIAVSLIVFLQFNRDYNLLAFDINIYGLLVIYIIGEITENKIYKRRIDNNKNNKTNIFSINYEIINNIIVPYGVFQVFNTLRLLFITKDIFTKERMIIFILALIVSIITMNILNSINKRRLYILEKEI